MRVLATELASQPMESMTPADHEQLYHQFITVRYWLIVIGTIII